jgi:signal transduction histidine kinase
MTDHSRVGRHILDPVDGYDDRVDDDKRIDYRRVQLGAVIMGAEAVFEAAMNTVRNLSWIWILLIIVAAGAVLFGVRARRAQRFPARADPWLVEGFVLFGLLCLNAVGYVGAQGIRVPMGYPMGYLAAAAFFMIPPRRFAAIGLATYAIFVAWVSTLDISMYDKLFPIANTGIALIAGGFGRASIDRIQRIGRQNRLRIADQNVALHRANAALERQNGELNELMAIAAHDLRSPLFGLRGVLDLARARPPETPDKLQRLLDAASRSITTMVALVSRLLDVHEAESRIPPPLRRKDLRQLLANAIKMVEQQSAAAGVTIDLAAPERAVWALAHAESVAQILDNLLSNAIRFSPSGTTICASVGVLAGNPIIEVADHGIGVPDTDRPKLFDKFQRGTSQPPNGQRGSGLGLYIVRVLAEGMGAQCAYQPNLEGGSIFSISFRAAGIKDNPGEARGQFDLRVSR